MRKGSINQEIAERLLAYLNGELSEPEREEVRKWMDEKPEHREEYSRMKQDYLYIRWVQQEQKVDESKAKKLVMDSLNGAKIRKIWYSVAASVVVLIAMGGVVLTKNASPEKILADKQEVIEPGSKQARLVLSTGEIVDLATGANTIREQDGSVVKVDSSQGVIYDTSKIQGAGKLIYNKIVVPKGGEFFLTLCDGTKVWLNSDSELEYPVKFSGKKREVKLKGEAYFSVREDKRKPFIVKSGEYQLQVYGTEFNLNTYHPENIQAVLVKGSVGFKANVKAPEQKLQPNQAGVANTVTGQVEIREVDVYPYIAWKNQDVVFVNERLESIMEKAARWYDIEVFYQKESLKDLRFYGNMQRYADIQELLFFLEKTSNARFKVNGRTVVINEK